MNIPLNCLYYRNTSIISAFEREVEDAVKEYVDRLLEEVSEDQATALKNTDSEMILKDTKLRYLMQFDDLFTF